MGQTQSQQPDVAQMYASYIQQQQNLIFQQQQQINSLYSHNLRQSQPTPNMMFQQQQQQAPQRSLPQLAPPPKEPKLDPYKILGLAKNYDEKTLKRAYLKAAMRAHPDRGGSPQLFQRVSIAYTVLTNKLKERDNSHSHHELREGAKEYLRGQASQPKRNVKMTEKFDAELFNKIYEENKIPDEFDRGYGSWMEKNPALESGQKRMFQDGFNKDMFNATFEKYKQEHAQKHAGQLVKYEEPEVRLSMRNQDSLVTLGQGKVRDFSGTSDNLHYTDYKKAFTDGAMMIDPSSVSLDGRATSIGGVKSQRSNLSYRLSAEDEKRLALQQMREAQQEKDRVKRLQVYDQRHGQAYEKIHSMLLR
tara:strand:- start:803 stop:1885 length:1083 start_codon:yes stop_codon:yes gene_type:complete